MWVYQYVKCNIDASFFPTDKKESIEVCPHDQEDTFNSYDNILRGCDDNSRGEVGVCIKILRIR
jgi:hypothetical protein